MPEAGLHLTHVVWVLELPPPQASLPSWLWRYLASGNWGSEQLEFVTGLKISADLRPIEPVSPRPPVINTKQQQQRQRNYHNNISRIKSPASVVGAAVVSVAVVGAVELLSES